MAFGLHVESDFALPGLGAPPDEEAAPRVSIRLVEPRELAQSWSGPAAPPAWRTVLGDGASLQLEHGTAGDYRLSYGSATFHISADGKCLLAAPDDALDFAWQRQLLDTALYSASFARGFELLHASGVEFEHGVVAFMTRSGGGKTSLAAELVRRGHPLFCDDVLAFGWSPEGLRGFPGPAVMNLPYSSVSPEQLGATVIARFPEEEELWVALEAAVTSPRRISALYLLDSCKGRANVNRLAAPTLLDLLPHSISLPHPASRDREHFKRLSTLAEEAQIGCIGVSPDTDPTALADLVESAVSELDNPASAASR